MEVGKGRIITVIVNKCHLCEMILKVGNLLLDHRKDSWLGVKEVVSIFQGEGISVK